MTLKLHHWPNSRVPWRSFDKHWVVRLVEYLNQGVLLRDYQTRPTELVIGIEPDVKDRPESRQSFTEKVLFLLHEGIHVMVVYVISLPAIAIRQTILERPRLNGGFDNGKDNASNERLWLSSDCALPSDDPQPHLQVKEWAYPAAVGQPLASLPLFLKTDQLWVIVDLQQSYTETIEAGRYRPV